MQTIVRWLTSPEAADARLDEVSRLIRRRASTTEPAEVRATRAQLVHHPLRALEARIRREEAIAQGATARPIRDLEKSAWAQPLRTDETGLALLIDALTRLRNGASDPYKIPADLFTRLGLEPAAARRALQEALNHLRNLRPDFYRANVFLHMERGEYCQDLRQPLSPEELLIKHENQAEARHELARLVNKELTPGKSELYRHLLTQISHAIPMSGPNLIAWTVHEFTLTETAACDLIKSLIHLTVEADLECDCPSPPN
jgi:hypothetical protein